MVHKKYSWRNGVRYGPYYYENKRVNGKVVTTYLGSELPDEKNIKINDKRKLGVLFVVFLMFAIGFLMIYMFQQGNIAGRVVLDIKTSYAPNENLGGMINVFLKAGEFIPKNTEIRASLGRQSKTMLLSELVSSGLTNGVYYSEGSGIIGQGDGYGVAGARTIYPDVSFELMVYELIEAPVESGGVGRVIDEPVEEAEEIINKTDTSTGDESIVVIPEEETEEVINKTDNNADEENVEEVVEEIVESEGSNENVGESEESGNSNVIDSGVRAITGAVVDGFEELETPYVITGEVKKGSNFVHELKEGQGAKIVSGSVSVNGNKIDDGVVSLSVMNNKAQVKTEYEIIKEGFGEEYLGLGEGLELGFGMEKFGLIAENGELNVVLDYSGRKIASFSEKIVVEGGENTSEEEMVELMRAPIKPEDAAAPGINFASSTPASGSTQNSTTVLINISITDNNDLQDIIFNWNETNYTLRDSYSKQLLQLINNTAFGENNTWVQDVYSGIYNGSLTGNPTFNYTGGKGAPSMIFSGDDYITFAKGYEIGSANYTYTTWLKRTGGTGSWRKLWSTNGGWEWYLSNANKIDSYSPGIYGNYILNIGEWTFVAITRNDTRTTIWVNGTWDGDSSNANGNKFNTFGKGENLVGEASFITFHNRSLTPEEIGELYMTTIRKIGDSQWEILIEQTKDPRTPLGNGTYTYQMFVKNNGGVWNSTEQRTITIGEGVASDTTSPVLYIQSPANTTYTTRNISINLSATDTNLNTIWFYNGTANLTYSVNTSIIYANGQHTFIAYANDTSNNINETKVVFVVSASPYVAFQGQTLANGTIVGNLSVEINVSIIDTSASLAEVKFNWNGTNYTIYNDSLVLMMNFENLSALGENGTKVVDMSKYGNNGTVTGAIINSTGKYGLGGSFDGTTDFIRVNANFGANLTISAWAKSYVANPNGKMLWCFDNDNTGPDLYVFSTGIYLNTFDGTGNPFVGCTPPSLTSWHHFTTVISPVSGETKLYIDGILCGAAAYRNPTSTSFFVSSGAGYDWNGLIDEVKIWNRTLSANEVNVTYQSSLRKFNSTDWEFYVNESAVQNNKTYLYSASVKDSAGNEGSTGFRSVEIDLVSPIITITTPGSGTTYLANFSLNVSIVDYECNLKAIKYNVTFVSTGTTMQWNETNFSSPYLCDASFTSVLGLSGWADGNYNLTVEAGDAQSQTPPSKMDARADDNTFTVGYNDSDNGLDMITSLEIFSQSGLSGQLSNKRENAVEISMNNKNFKYNVRNDGKHVREGFEIDKLGNREFIKRTIRVNEGFRLEVEDGSKGHILVYKEGNFMPFRYIDHSSDVDVGLELSAIQIDARTVEVILSAGSAGWGKVEHKPGKTVIKSMDTAVLNYAISSVVFGVDNSIPFVGFQGQTPANGTGQTQTFVGINVSIIDRGDLNEIKFNWNGTNETIIGANSTFVDMNFSIADLVSLNWTANSSQLGVYGNDLVLMMNFENLSALGENGTKVVDMSKYGNNGTVTGAIINSTGKYGLGGSFDGTTDFIRVNANFGANLTISAWAKSYVANPNGKMLWCFDNDNHGPDLYVSSTGIYLNTFDGTGNPFVGCTPPSLTSWHHFTAVINPVTGETKLYINGTLCGAAAYRNPTSTSFFVSSGAGFDWNGLIDEVRIWNRSLSAGEIQQLYYSNLQKYNTQNWSFSATENPLNNFTLDIQNNGDRIRFMKSNSTNYEYYTNKSGLGVGSYLYRAFVKDSAGNINSTEQRTISIDTTLPILYIQSPANTTYTTSNVSINLSATDTNLGSIWFYNGSANLTYSVNTSVVYANGQHTFIAYANDSAGNRNETKVIFTVLIADTTSPILYIQSPQNITYATTNISINLSATDTNLSTIWFYNGTANLTYSVNTSVVYANGQHTFIAYANDSAGNLNSTSVTFAISSSAVALYVGFQGQTPANGTTITNTAAQINVSIIDTSASLAEVKFNWNGTNYTIYNDSLVLMMNFENRSALGENGAKVVDISKYGNNGTTAGNAIVNSTGGNYGWGLNLDGDDDYVTINTASPLHGGVYTISAWVYPTSSSFPYEAVILTDANTYYFMLSTRDLFGQGTGYGIGWYSGSWYGTSSGTSVASELNKWTHVTGIYNGTGFSLYKNGRLIRSNSVSLSGVGGTTSYISYYSESYNMEWFGRIDEVRFWNRTLSASEIYELYASNLQKFNSTNWELYVNQSKNATDGLDLLSYTYQAFVKDSSGNVNSTEQRTVSSADCSSINPSNGESCTGNVNFAGHAKYSVPMNFSNGTINALNINISSGAYVIYRNVTLYVKDLIVEKGGKVEFLEGSKTIWHNGDWNISGTSISNTETHIINGTFTSPVGINVLGGGNLTIYDNSNITIGQDISAYFPFNVWGNLTLKDSLVNGIKSRGIDVKSGAGDVRIGNITFATMAAVPTGISMASDVKLIGEVRGDYYGVNISANNLRLDCDSGAKINYSLFGAGYGINLDYANGTNIKNCYVAGGGTSANGYGINFNFAWFSNITDAIVSTIGASGYGINFNEGGQNNFTNVTIDTIGGSASGLYLSPTSGTANNNRFKNGKITTLDSTAFGVYVSPAVSRAEIINSNLTMRGGANAIYLSGSHNNTLANNSISSIGGASDAIYVYANSDNNIIDNNTIYSAGGDGIDVSSGGPPNYPTLNNISRNTFNSGSITSYDININTDDTFGGTWLIDQIGKTNDYSFTSSNLVVQESDFGKVNWFMALTEAGGNLTKNITITNNSVIINSVNTMGLNKSANVTFFNFGNRGYTSPAVLRDGSVCSACYNFTALTANTVVFNVTGWSNYSIGEGPAGELSSCGNLTSANTAYNLSQSVSGAGTCIEVGANNVSLDCVGYSIAYASSTAGYGVYNPGGYSNFSLRGCNITQVSGGQTNSHGVLLQGQVDGVIEFNNITSIGSGCVGVYISNSNQTNVTSNNISTLASGEGIYVVGSRNNIQGNKLRTYSDAIYVYGDSDYNVIDNNTIYSSGDDGIELTFNGASIYPNLNNITRNIFKNITNQEIDITSDGTSVGQGTWLIDQAINKFALSSSYAEVLHSTFGHLRLLSVITAVGNNFSSNVTFRNDSIFIDPNQIGFNLSANVTFFSIGNRGYTTPAILKNGATCPDCSNFSALTALTVVFNVTGWSNYSIGEQTDIWSPTYSNNNTNPASPVMYLPSASYQFNISWTDTYNVDTVIITFGGANTTLTSGTSIYTFTKNDLGVSNYTYYWWANDSSGNTNITQVYTYIISPAPGAVTTTINGVRGNTSVNEGSVVELNGTLVNGTGSIYLYENYDLINAGASPLSNSTNYTKPGTYIIKTQIYAGENYTSGLEQFTLTVNDTHSPIVYFTNNTPTNNSVFAANTTSVDINFSISESAVTDIKIGWNLTNYSIYDSYLLVMHNYDNSTAGTSENDLSNKDNDGVLVGGVGRGTGKYGFGVNFSGSDYVMVNPDSNDNLVITNNSMTIEAWINTSAAAPTSFFTSNEIIDTQIENVSISGGISNMGAIESLGGDIYAVIWENTTSIVVGTLNVSQTGDIVNNAFIDVKHIIPTVTSSDRGDYADMLHVSGNIYLMYAYGRNLTTLSIEADGTITNPLIDIWYVDNMSNIGTARLFLISGSVYGVLFDQQDTRGERILTFSVDGAGDIDNSTSYGHTIDNSQGLYHYSQIKAASNGFYIISFLNNLTLVSFASANGSSMTIHDSVLVYGSANDETVDPGYGIENIGGSNYALSYSGGYANGWVQTFSINASGANDISLGNRGHWRLSPVWTEKETFTRIGTTDVYAVGYKDRNLDAYTIIETFRIYSNATFDSDGDYNIINKDLFEMSYSAPFLEIRGISDNVLLGFRDDGSNDAVRSINLQRQTEIYRYRSYYLYATSGSVFAGYMGNPEVSASHGTGWHHYATTFSSSGNDGIRLYIDGVLAASANRTNDALPTYNETLYIGRGVAGTLDNVRIWNRALSNDEISLAFRTSIIKTGTSTWQTETLKNITGEGNYTLQACVYDINGNMGCTEPLFYTRLNDTSAPLIEFVSPTPVNGANLSMNNIEINVSVSDMSLSKIVVWVYNSTLNQINMSVSSSSPLYFNLTGLSDGVYYFNASANDTYSNTNFTETRRVVLDTIIPSVNIVYPLNTSYNINVSNLNYTVGDSYLRACWYSLNDGANNVSVTCGNNLTNLTSNEGSNKWVVWANDSSNNVNYSRVVFVKDTIAPLIAYISPTPNDGDVANSSSFIVNVSVTELNENTIVFRLIDSSNNLVNETISTSGIRSLTYNNLAGLYYFNVSINDSLGNTNSTATRNVTLKGPFVAPVDSITAQYNISGSINGYIYSGSNYSTNQFINFSHPSYGLRAEFEALFSSQNVNLSSLVIEQTNHKTSINKTGVSGVAANHTLYVPRVITDGVYVCPNTKSISDVVSTCSGKVSFTDAEASTGTWSSGYYAFVKGSNYGVANLTGSGISTNVTDCGEYSTNITMNGEVYSYGTCMTLNGEGITLNCAGNTIFYGKNLAASGYSYGVSVLKGNVTVRNCKIVKIDASGSGNYGITTGSLASGGLFVNNTIITNGSGTSVSGGIFTNEDDRNIVIENNTIYVNTFGSGNSMGVYSYLSRYINISNNAINTTNNDSGYCYGVYAIGSENFIIRNNIITLNGSQTSGYVLGISLHSASYSDYSENHSIIGNVVNIFASGDSNAAIELYDTNKSSVSHNSINAQGSGQNNMGIYVYSFSSLIESNNITTRGVGNIDYGISISDGSKYNTLLNNHFINTTGKPIFQQGYNSSLNYFVYNNSYGEIKWSDEIFLRDIDFSGNLTFPGTIIILNNSVYFNVSAITMTAGVLGTINSSANITLYNVGNRGYTSPAVLRDGSVCSACYNFTALNANTVVFNVTGWSNYSIGEGAANNAPTVVLDMPFAGNKTVDRTPRFEWNGSDADSDPLTYVLNVSLVASSTCTDTEKYITGIVDENYTFTSDLKCLYDNSDYYVWSVRADDTKANSSWAGPRAVNISSLVQISLPTNAVEFGSIHYQGQNDTSDDSPVPFVVQNDGNCYVNVSVDATNLWSVIANPNSYYMFAANVSSEGSSAFSWAPSITGFSAFQLTGSATNVSMVNLNYTDATDSAQLEVYVQVPPDEGSNVRSSTVTLTASLSE